MIKMTQNIIFTNKILENRHMVKCWLMNYNTSFSSINTYFVILAIYHVSTHTNLDL